MENLVVGLETARKLKEAGFPQDTYFGYDPYGFVTSADIKELQSEHGALQRDIAVECAAPTAQEIADPLPNNITLGGRIYYLDFGKTYARYLWEEYDVSEWLNDFSANADTMAEALAALWLKLKEK